MKTKLISISVIIFLFCVAGCKKNNPTPTPGVTPPTISGINPTSGPENTVVTITGNNFGTDAAKVKVFFNSVAATVQTVVNTQILAMVPSGAGTGKVKVQVDSQSADGPVFTYTAPALSIASISPTSGPKNSSVTITGNNFGTDTSLIKVFFNGVIATVQSVTNTQIIATVPPRAGTGNVKVQLNALSLDGPIFNYVLSATVTTIAGNVANPGFADGPGSTARFAQPVGVAVDGQGNVFVTDDANQRIRKIAPGGVVSTFAGSAQQGLNDGTGSAAQFYNPTGIASDALGNLVVADSRSYLIRQITPQAVVTTLAGNIVLGFMDGTGSNAHFNNPEGVAMDGSGNIYVVDYNNHSIRKITPGGVVTTLAGNGTPGYVDGTGSAARFRHPFGLTVDGQGNVYVADEENFRIRKITAAGVVSTIAGDGTFGYLDGDASTAKFGNLSDLKIDAQGNIFIADRGNHCIRKMTPTGTVSTVAGIPTHPGFIDGGSDVARFYQPYGIALDTQGNIYVADYLNFSIRKITME